MPRADDPVPRADDRRATPGPVRPRGGGDGPKAPGPRDAGARTLELIGFLEELAAELESMLGRRTPDPYLKMTTHLIRSHLDGRTVTPSSLAAAAGVPYATAMRRMAEMTAAGHIEHRPRTRSGKSVSLHPSAELLRSWTRFADRVGRIGGAAFGAGDQAARDFFFGGSYMAGQLIPPPRALPEPLALPGGLRVLVHGDPTFMVMGALKRQFEQLVGCPIAQRAFSIDRLREEALRNAERRVSRYDIVAVDLPWIGEFAEDGVLLPLDEAMDVERLVPSDFHAAGWEAGHWGGRCYGVPSQATPELLFYRRDLFAGAGLEPPATTDGLLAAARALHDPTHGRYGIAWNAARGTALGHTFLMACADFDQPILDLARIPGGFRTDELHRGGLRPMLDAPGALEAAEYLVALMECSPPDILSMSWYERVRPYASGRVAMAYGYTLLAPYFELDPASPACGRTGYLPHPPGPQGTALAPVGGYALGIPANLPEERRAEVVEALVAFTSPEAQKLYALNGSRTAPRYSVGSDPEVRGLSPIFEAVDGMSRRDELQFWPRPPVPRISAIIAICGQELHDMLRGVTSPRDALARAQRRAEAVMRND